MGKSALTNGGRLVLIGDGRSAEGRRWADLLDHHLADMGGPDGLTMAQDGLARRSATIGTWCDLQEAALASGGDMDMEQYLGAVNTLRRLYTTMGLHRRARDVTPNPLDYAKGDPT